MPKSKIEWTERVWNPVTGCDKISQGCKNCYAESIANRFWKDRKFTDVMFHEDRLKQVGSIKKPSMIFVNSMSDLFHAGVPLTFIDKVFEQMYGNPNHTFQVLTKRPRQMKEWFYRPFNEFKGFAYPYAMRMPADNIWLGVSVENQFNANLRIPLLLQTPAKVRWLSIEPLIGPITLPSSYLDKPRYFELGTIDWVVIGCESGPRRRECKLSWVESLVDHCKANKVPVFVKQLQINGKVVKDIEKFPKHLQIREYPNEQAIYRY